MLRRGKAEFNGGWYISGEIRIPRLRGSLKRKKERKNDKKKKGTLTREPYTVKKKVLFLEQKRGGR